MSFTLQLLSIALYTLCVLLGDLNIVRDNTQLQNFCEYFLLEHLVKKPTCYKGDTPTGIDHIITNIPKRFMKSMTLETSISDHHKMIMSIFRSTFAKGKHKTFYYCCYKKFNLEQFQMVLKKNQMKFPTTHLIFLLKNLKHVFINSLHSKKKKLD